MSTRNIVATMRREPKRADALVTENKIVAAAFTVLNGGPDTVTVTAIAEAAGVSNSRVYKYSTLEEILDAATTAEAKRMVAAVTSVGTDAHASPDARIQATLEAILLPTGPHNARLHTLRIIASGEEWDHLASAIGTALGSAVPTKANHIGNGILGILRGACGKEITRDDLIIDATNMTLSVHFFPEGHPRKR